MDMDQAAVFLAGSILTGLGFVALAITAVIINNIISAFWKPIQWVKYDSIPKRFLTEEEIRQELKSESHKKD